MKLKVLNLCYRSDQRQWLLAVCTEMEPVRW